MGTTGSKVFDAVGRLGDFSFFFFSFVSIVAQLFARNGPIIARPRFRRNVVAPILPRRQKWAKSRSSFLWRRLKNATASALLLDSHFSRAVRFLVLRPLPFALAHFACTAWTRGKTARSKNAVHKSHEMRHAAAGLTFAGRDAVSDTVPRLDTNRELLRVAIGQPATAEDIRPRFRVHGLQPVPGLQSGGYPQQSFCCSSSQLPCLHLRADLLTLFLLTLPPTHSAFFFFASSCAQTHFKNTHWKAYTTNMRMKRKASHKVLALIEFIDFKREHKFK